METGSITGGRFAGVKAKAAAFIQRGLFSIPKPYGIAFFPDRVW